MSRLCRLKNATHGEDGLWAYNEITRLRFELEGVHSCGPTCTRDACVNRRLREKLKIAEEALHKYRDNVLFRIGSASPYREVAHEYYEYIKPVLAKIRRE